MPDISAQVVSKRIGVDDSAALYAIFAGVPNWLCRRFAWPGPLEDMESVNSFRLTRRRPPMLGGEEIMLLRLLIWSCFAPTEVDRPLAVPRDRCGREPSSRSGVCLAEPRPPAPTLPGMAAAVFSLPPFPHRTSRKVALCLVSQCVAYCFSSRVAFSLTVEKMPLWFCNYFPIVV